MYRERIWQALKERQRLNLSTLPDRVLTAVDLALWDLAGKAARLKEKRVAQVPASGEAE